VGLSRWPVRERVLVNLIEGDTFAGILHARRGPLLYLRDVSVIGADGVPSKVDGEILIERHRVDFIQLHR
jgi:small nuclear ribonucleoprotein (snRNP)-like protein